MIKIPVNAFQKKKKSQIMNDITFSSLVNSNLSAMGNYIQKNFFLIHSANYVAAPE